MPASSSDERPAPEFTGRLRAVTVGRLATFLGVMVLLIATGGSLVDPAGWPLLMWAGAGYLVCNLVVLVLPPRRSVQRVALDVSLLVDAVAVGVTLAVTGGPASPLAFLLYAAVVALTLVFGWWTGVRACILLSLALAWVVSTGPPALTEIVEVLGDRDLALSQALQPEVRTVLLMLGVWFVAGLVATLSTVTERELRGLIDDLALLRDINHDMDSSQDLAQVSDKIAETLVDVFGYERAVVWLPEGDELVAVGGAGLDAAALAELGSRRVASQSYPLRNAVRAGAPWPVPRDDPRPGALERMLGKDAPLVLVPMGDEERLLGVITAVVPRRLGRPPRLRHRDVRLLAMLRGEAALVLDNARLHAKLRARAVTDALTGLPNHGFFQQRLEEELHRADRRRGRGELADLSLVLFDLDHFKDINDTYGHPTGDEVLRAVARTSSKVLRSADVLCRYGGEEFAIILPDTDGRNARRACERIREALGRLELTADDGRPLEPVTASFGVAPLGDRPADRAPLLARADEALYTAKRAGRDRIALARDVSELTSARR